MFFVRGVAFVISMFLLFSTSVKARTLYHVEVKDILSEASVSKKKRELSSEEAQVLSEGPISEGRKVGALVTGIVAGFGTGHALVGKYSDTGYLFTLLDTFSAGILIWGVVLTSHELDEQRNFERENPGEDGSGKVIPGFLLTVAGGAAVAGSRTFEAIDLNRSIKRHNMVYRYVENQMQRAKQWRIVPILTTRVAGAQLQFRF